MYCPPRRGRVRVGVAYGGKAMIKHLILLGIIIGTLPFWLPTSLGGETSYHFVLSESMKGTLDPGAFVILRRSDTYEVGDAVAYRIELGDGNRATILHRIVAGLPNGDYIVKGDAVESSETVASEAITGRMVFAVPALGFLPGAFRQAPVLLGGMLLALFLLAGGLMKAVDRRAKGAGKRPGWNDEKPSPENPFGKLAKEENLFLPALLLVMVSIPFAKIVVGQMVPTFIDLGAAEGLLSQVPLFALLVAVLAVTRFGEIFWVKRPQGGSSLVSLAGINYGAVMILAAATIPFAQMLQSARTVLTF